jgi:hypothetical protein
MVGVIVGRQQQAITVRSAGDARPAFLLLLMDPDSPAPGRSHEELVAEYSAWARQLHREGRLIDAAELADGGRVLGAPAGREATEVGGYFMIRAVDLEEAAAVAAKCPHLKYGGAVEVRAVRG